MERVTSWKPLEKYGRYSIVTRLRYELEEYQVMDGAAVVEFCGSNLTKAREICRKGLQ